ncbi:hypothetical protein NDU88_012397, partial [Pleurodeles waltl]
INKESGSALAQKSREMLDPDSPEEKRNTMLEWPGRKDEGVLVAAEKKRGLARQLSKNKEEQGAPLALEKSNI